MTLRASDKILFTLIYLLGSIAIIAVVYGMTLEYQIDQKNEIIYNLTQRINEDMCVLYDGYQFKEKVVAEGIYWQGTKYYCVWAENRHFDYYELTDRHEYCHYLVEKEYNHFCGDDVYE